jgi:hypothetical protein
VRLATFALVALAGCNATYAPPIRAFQYGAPARLTEGRVEIGGTAGGLAVPNIGGPHLAIGIRDWVAIEAGGNLQLLGNANDRWAMGFIGPRFSWAPNRKAPVHFIGDLELGVGAGVGGELNGSARPGSKECPPCDDLNWSDRIAWGGYQGIGLGLQINWFSIYGRVRFEESTATNIPTTIWPSASLGLEANILSRAAITVGGGYIGYANGNDHENGWFWQLGVSVFFDAFKRHDAHAAVEPTPPRPQVPQQGGDEPKREEED